MKISLSLTDTQYTELKAHLFPGDGKEAVAFALCGHRAGAEIHRLLVREIFCVPHEKCILRTADQIKWPTEILPPLLDKASKRELSLLKIHSHPTGLAEFSPVDDNADDVLFVAVHTWVDGVHPHASAIMLPDGSIFGRAITVDSNSLPLSFVNIVGDDLVYWYADGIRNAIPEFAQSHGQAFGSATFDKLNRLRIAVVGCSGTGSPVIEQLARLGVGHLLLVDPDHVEKRNLNRILNATATDADKGTKKVDVMARAIDAMGLGTTVQTFSMHLCDPEIVKAVAECDVIFGCMDGLSGRQLLNRLATFYSIPYFDVGVKLEADGKGSVDQVIGTVHYFKPGQSSFLSRGVFTQQMLSAESIKKTDPVHYGELLESKYIKGVQENRLAVISVNMLFAALAVNEFLARLHPYRIDPNSGFAIHTFSLSHAIYEARTEGEPCPTLAQHIGRGDSVPLLGLPILSSEVNT